MNIPRWPSPAIVFGVTRVRLLCFRIFAAGALGVVLVSGIPSLLGVWKPEAEDAHEPVVAKDAELILEFYEVSDLVPTMSYPAPEIGLRDPAEEEGSSEINLEAERLIEMAARALVSEEGVLELSGGVLVVRKPRADQERIRKLLASLR